MKGVEIERDPNGRAIAAVARWRDDGGVQRKKKFKGAGCVGQAQKHKTAAENAKNAGNYVDTTNKTTVQQFARAWIDARVYRESSARYRESQFTVHVEDSRLGKTRLVSVRKSDIQTWVTEVAKRLGPSATRDALGLVRSVFAAAAEDRLLAHNPALGRFSLPTAELDPVVPLTVESVHRLAEAVPDQKKAMVIVQAATGVRAGELMGWQVREVDFLRRMVVVREQLDPRKRTRIPLKTPSSRRDLPLPQIAIEALAAHLKEFPANDDGFIFTDEQNRPWQYKSYNDSVGLAADSLGLPHTTTHDMRHHYASVLLDAGESVVTVAARLGHKDAKLVLSTYGHLMPNTEDRTRRAVDDAWRALSAPATAVVVP